MITIGLMSAIFDDVKLSRGQNNTSRDYSNSTHDKLRAKFHSNPRTMQAEVSCPQPEKLVSTIDAGIEQEHGRPLFS